MMSTACPECSQTHEAMGQLDGSCRPGCPNDPLADPDAFTSRTVTRWPKRDPDELALIDSLDV